jgi:hypothetical protein
VYLPINLATFTAAATAAALINGTDYAVADRGAIVRVLPLSMKGLRFLVWETATNGAPGLGQDVPIEDIATLRANLEASLAGKATAWNQT